MNPVKDSIWKAFNNDHIGLVKYTDPDADIQSFEDVVEDVYRKLSIYSESIPCEFVPLENGYIFYSEGRLISFAISPDSRTPRGLKQLWSQILEHVGQEFYCLLFSKNTRAIRYLVAMGMEIDSEFIHDNNEITKLCHH